MLKTINKELVYSSIFLVASFLWLSFNPFAQIRDLTNGGYSVKTIMVIGFFIFIILSFYFGLKAMKKSSVGEEKKFLGIPTNIPFWLALIVFLLSATLTIYTMLLLTGIVSY